MDTETRRHGANGKWNSPLPPRGGTGGESHDDPAPCLRASVSHTSAPRWLLFDLDGTLVRMKRRWIEFRFVLRATWRFAGAIPPWRFPKALYRAIGVMQTHGTERTNYEVVLAELARHSRKPRTNVEERARALIRSDFATLADRFHPIPGARVTLELARALGYRLVLATNPVWPLEAVKMRMAWGGIGDVPFEYITNSETMTRCKPDPGFYRELLAKLGLRGEECLMIGNDPRKDLPAKEAGIRTFLLSDRRIEDPRLDAWGSHEQLQECLKRWARRN